MQRHHCDLGEVRFMSMTKSSVTIREPGEGMGEGKGGSGNDCSGKKIKQEVVAIVGNQLCLEGIEDEGQKHQ